MKPAIGSISCCCWFYLFFIFFFFFFGSLRPISFNMFTGRSTFLFQGDTSCAIFSLNFTWKWISIEYTLIALTLKTCNMKCKMTLNGIIIIKTKTTSTNERKELKKNKKKHRAPRSKCKNTIIFFLFFHMHSTAWNAIKVIVFCLELNSLQI